MRRLACTAIAVAFALTLFGCGDDDGSDDGGPVVVDPPGPPPPPPPPPTGGILCVCPGFFGRPFGACPRPPFDGDLEIGFTCSPTSAVFENDTCGYRINSSNSLALLVRPTDVFVPISPPERRFPIIINTQANDPPGGVVTLSATDLSNNQPVPIGDVLVSNNCP